VLRQGSFGPRLPSRHRATGLGTLTHRMKAELDPWVENPAKAVVPRAALLVRTARGVARSVLVNELRAYRTRVLKQMPPDSTARLGIPHSDDPLGSGVEEWDAMPTADAFVEISWPSGTETVDLTEPVRDFRASLDGVIDPAGCAAVAGPCHLLETGTGPVALAGGARRAPGTTRDQLIDWWFHHHGPLVLSILDPKPLGYQQLHADPALSRQLADAAGVGPTEYDMFASSYFASVNDFFEPLAKPGVSERLRADEEGHYDHSSMFGALFEMV
jgi:hypothetical protein